jgi:Binding-protein-dependent transport system inner membrane component
VILSGLPAQPLTDYGLPGGGIAMGAGVATRIEPRGEVGIWPDGAAFVDGEYVPIAEARLPILGWGFLRSDCTYDVVHVWNGRLFRLGHHLDRFEKSVAGLHLKDPYGRDETVAILLFRRFFRDLPSTLFDAAMIDGCGHARFFWHVTLPLSRPILSTVAVFVFVQNWNAYLLPLVILNSESICPWPLGIMMFQGEYMTQWNLVLAFITLTILPAIVPFLVARKHIISGLTAGGIKG